MNSRLYECIAPIASIASLTAIAMIPLLVNHIYESEQRLVEQRRKTEFGELFLINCLSGRTMVVGRTEGVKCVKL